MHPSQSPATVQYGRMRAFASLRRAVHCLTLVATFEVRAVECSRTRLRADSFRNEEQEDWDEHEEELATVRALSLAVGNARTVPLFSGTVVPPPGAAAPLQVAGEMRGNPARRRVELVARLSSSHCQPAQMWWRLTPALAIGRLTHSQLINLSRHATAPLTGPI